MGAVRARGAPMHERAIDATPSPSREESNVSIGLPRPHRWVECLKYQSLVNYVHHDTEKDDPPEAFPAITQQSDGQGARVPWCQLGTRNRSH